MGNCIQQPCCRVHAAESTESEGDVEVDVSVVQVSPLAAPQQQTSELSELSPLTGIQPAEESPVADPQAQAAAPLPEQASHFLGTVTFQQGFSAPLCSRPCQCCFYTTSRDVTTLVDGQMVTLSTIGWRK